MKKYLRTSIVMFLLLAFLSSFERVIYSSQPPQGYTGSDGFYCTNCHATNPLNSDGGSVLATGLPDGGYTAGASYNFSIAIAHSVADRQKWGFEISARNSANQPVGTFSTTNPNAALNGNELAHFNAVATEPQQSYIYNNLTWTAPANPGPNDQSVTFYYAGNAANSNGSSSEDFIYAGSKLVSLALTYTFTGNGAWGDPANWANGTVPPAVINGSATIVIDPPVNGECVLNGIQHIGSAANLIVKAGKKFRIAGDLVITN